MDYMNIIKDGAVAIVKTHEVLETIHEEFMTKAETGTSLNMEELMESVMSASSFKDAVMGGLFGTPDELSERGRIMMKLATILETDTAKKDMILAVEHTKDPEKISPAEMDQIVEMIYLLTMNGLRFDPKKTLEEQTENLQLPPAEKSTDEAVPVNSTMADAMKDASDQQEGDADQKE